jgi:hypothetical protein
MAGGVPTLDQPFTQAEHDQLLRRYDRLVDQLVDGVTNLPRLSKAEEQKLKSEREQLLEEYFARLPRLSLSRCPHCGEVLRRAFDPWGLNGLWWQPSEAKQIAEPTVCSHFAVLLGAVSVNGLPPHAGPYGANSGPEVPYVIPEILKLPTMVAVLSSLPMANGYTAYPIAYFSEKPPAPGSLTAPWTKRQYNYKDASGGSCWTIKTDPWDFDLVPWAAVGKLKWIPPGSGRLEISEEPATAFPYANLPGKREQLVIQNDRLSISPPPRGEDIEPFE